MRKLLVNGSERSEDARTRIQREMLDHVKRFGLRRTRLVALAEDLGMSHANIYRYFKNKNEIIDSIALAWLAEAEDMVTRASKDDAPPKTQLIELLTVLNSELHRKLGEEPAAEQIFAHVFNEHPEKLASHLASMKMRVGELVIRHEALSGSPGRAPATLDTMTVVLEPLVNPLLMIDRSAESDRPRIKTLIDGLLT